MTPRTAAAALCAAVILLALPARAEGERVVVGSKAFAESWILGEALALLARRSGANVEHAQNLGTTEITYAALASASIDVYPEYTGTIREVLLRGVPADTKEAMSAALAQRGLGVSAPLGFDDGYALATSEAVAARESLRTISDLRRLPDLRVGLTHEFMARPDGYPGLVARYGLALREVRGVQHELALDALARGELDVVDVYTTDAQIESTAAAPPRGRSRVLSSLRRGAALPPGLARAGATRVRGDDAARRGRRRGSHAGRQRRGHARRAQRSGGRERARTRLAE